ncbi:MAG: hypothetical protein KGS72_21155 [Cyanobacteria bacterium REEB67]|nr:hypothetical protein [Cyanobacteria bacterium REEB67]
MTSITFHMPNFSDLTLSTGSTNHAINQMHCHDYFTIISLPFNCTVRFTSQTNIFSFCP